VLHAARWKYRTQKLRKKSPSVHHRTTLSGYIFATKAFVHNQKKPVKQQYFVYMSSQRLRSVGEFGAPQQISTGFASWLRYCTNVAQRSSTKLCTMFGRLLGWYTVYTFWGLLLLIEFYQVQISLCVEVLRSILAALLHGTRAVGISQTLRRGTEVSLLACAIYIPQGGHHVGYGPTF